MSLEVAEYLRHLGGEEQRAQWQISDRRTGESAAQAENTSPHRHLFPGQPVPHRRDPSNLPISQLAPSLLGCVQKCMDVSLFQAAAAMGASARWQEVISENLAAGQIPGFKKQDLSFHAVQAGLMSRTSANHAGASRHSAMPVAATSTNFEAGELRPTGSNTDLAIDGPGFFQVQLPNGKIGYTRDGEFQFNTDGTLLTKQGFPVMGDTGPIQLDPNGGGPMTVAPSGTISQNGVTRGQLDIATFADPSQLTPAGSGLFISTNPDLQPAPSSIASVRQGVLESGNTSSMNEMSNLISSMRYFEANQKVIQNEDDRVGRLITDVANPAGSS